MIVRFTLSARSQFLDALEYIAADNPVAARRVKTKAERSLKKLATFPLIGRRIPEFPDLPHRELIVGPYRFFYRIDKKKIWIVAVWHGAQRPREPE